MERIESLLQPLLIWRQVILLFAVMLGLEGPALLLAAVWYRRPRIERLLAVAPIAVFCALLVVARGLVDTYTYWQSYTAWEVAHYPADFLTAMLAQTAQDAAPSAQGAAPLGIALAVLTAALLVGGWMLAIRWQVPPRPKAKRTGLVGVAPTAEEQGTLEIVVEAITDEPVAAGEAIEVDDERAAEAGVRESGGGSVTGSAG